MSQIDNYVKYRGKCRELAEEAIKQDPSLRLVRGYYHCPWWGKQQHWWTIRQDGSIHDPSCLQFPSCGVGEYEEFDGFIECAECGKKVAEEHASIDGRYAFCSYKCYGKFIGVL